MTQKRVVHRKDLIDRLNDGPSQKALNQATGQVMTCKYCGEYIEFHKTAAGGKPFEIGTDIRHFHGAHVFK